MKALTMEDVRAMFGEVADAYAANSEMLCAMDAKLGDGDLGLTMKRGFAACAEAMRDAQEPTIGRLIARAGMKMSSAVPSTMGTLMSSGLMAGGRAIADAGKMTASEYVSFLEGFCGGIAKRGKCAPGDRTVLDALDAAFEAARAALQAGGDLKRVAAEALEGARRGIESTRQMTPKFGKAAVFAAKALGEEDQGAVAGGLLIAAMNRYIQNRGESVSN